MSKIKICGLTRMQDIDAVNRFSPDYVGFVFAESKRRVDADTAARFRAELRAGIGVVGVFVNQPKEDILSLINAGIIDHIQLHGDEDDEYIGALKKRTDCPVIKAVRVGRDGFQKTTENHDFLLFDTLQENMRGGSGTDFDANLLKAETAPYFLAGGLNLENIRTKINLLNPFCVDVSSGVESDGKKDENKMRDLIAAVRSIQ